ncbi:MAG: cation-translocating P-type ATPase [Atopobiaceae bacterium]|jgi:Cd2+/Zn2+-exporting ATPase|nr:cation-translocating P-type ATPase [Atopobiaceae bacterium]MCI2172770.1 cation-translocating P-type ATPase [Atopobiaceae bacterium]MCI2207077.1 cation-translocating P-type ATPase [Atopobiaceae bacterium]
MEDPTFSYYVTDLDCPSCALSCQNAVRNLECVEDASLNYATGTLEVEKKPAAEVGHCRRHVLQTVRECGHDLDLTDTERGELEAERPWLVEHREQVLMGTSGVALAAGLLCENLLAQVAAARVLFVIGAVAGVAYILPMAVSALRRRTCDMNVLMTIAVIGALAMGCFEEAAVVIFLDQVGEWLEGWSMRKTRGSVTQLMSLAPDIAHVVSADGTTTDVDADDVEEGTLVRVLPGERVPLDGRIESGSSSFDEAPVTGESVPADKTVGDDVFGGTLNTSAVVEVTTTSDADESTLARIIAMVQGAQAEKAPYEAFVDRFAAVYTPVVVALAIVVGVGVPLVMGLVSGFASVEWYSWVYQALTLLVIACPCALVISTPVSFVSAITRAAKMGVLVKGGAYFDLACKVDAITFDKTGTLTSGEPKVSAVRVIGDASEGDVLAVAAALEANSTHPLAKAVVERASADATPVSATEVEEVVAGGMRGVVSGLPCSVGKPAFAALEGELGEEVTSAVDELTGTGATALVVMRDHAPLGVIGVADAIRESTPDALARLHDRDGISTLEMLTGDNRRAAQAVAATAGITQVAAELLPDGKVDEVRRLQAEGTKVAHVGDGINDAPALAAADLGITMGAAASDTALEVADVALLSGDLAQLPSFFELSHRTMNVVRENIVFAIAVKVVIMVLAVMGIANMYMAVFADTGVALIVILNGMRLMTKVDTRF